MTSSAATIGSPVGSPPTIGVLGRDWRATVSPWGAVQQWDGLGTLDWFVAGDDRWYVPSQETTVRQSLVEGTPVVETRVRIPKGDVVQRVYAVADHGGLTIVEVENDSPMPIAVAFSGVPVLSSRAPSNVPLHGADLPADTVTFPVGHHATTTVAIAHDPTDAAVVDGRLPAASPTAHQVVRGWLALVERASRLLVPDAALASGVVRERCQLVLDGPPDPTDDPIGFLFAVAELVRVGSVAEAWMPEVADAVAALTRHRDHPALGDVLDAAERVSRAADDPRATKDLRKVRAKLLGDATARTPRIVPASIDGLADVIALERAIADGPDLLPAGLPASWLGQHFEVYGVPTGAASAVSFALRWHGARPAVLWECTGDPVELTASTLAPEWRSAERTGETLWPEPPGASAVQELVSQSDDAAPPSDGFDSGSTSFS
ncbi:MAG: hypothetical protein ACK5CE_02240 [Actinomycetes bacterium]|uniref:Unannotated protein n=1 Tax=freshwater metagenome TaxID=449393 RepID=A0A6J6BI89_9ZZZZ